MLLKVDVIVYVVQESLSCCTVLNVFCELITCCKKQLFTLQMIKY